MNGCWQASSPRATERRGSSRLRLTGSSRFDDEGRIRDFNPAAERMFGRNRADAIGQEVAELISPPRFRDSHRRGCARFLATGKGQVLNARTDMTRVACRRHRVPGRVGRHAHCRRDPPLCSGYIRYVTERRRNEQRRAVRYAVTNALASADNVHNATSAVLRAVCETLGRQVGELWLVDRAAALLRLLEACSIPLDGQPEFMTVSSTWTFPQGVGLPGNVWASGEAVWLPDLALAGTSTRAELAAWKATLRSGLTSRSPSGAAMKTCGDRRRPGETKAGAALNV